MSDRGIQLSDRGKGKRRAELLELCQNAAKMKQQKLEEVVESFDRLLEEKLQTNQGLLPNPDTLRSWSHNFASIPEFTFADSYSYFVRKDDYSVRTSGCLKAYMDTSCSMMDTWTIYSAVDWKTNPFLTYSKVKPAERAKTRDGQSTYNGFLILKSRAEVHAAYCPCKGGSDGACKHVTAALFDLQSTVSNNLTNTCTLENCLWKCRNRKSDYAIRLEDLNIVKAEFGKEEKLHFKPYHFDPRSTLTNLSTLKEKLRQGLKQVVLCSSSTILA